MQGALTPMNFGLEGLEHSCIGNVLQVAILESIQKGFCLLLQYMLVSVAELCI